ncbi:MAG TPA: glycerophosphodiester phosphodiesterase [Chitinophagales bacterium]|nr:glycerophosphodiester phosphodiesterase [Chitinophagales bacterium]
MKYTYLSALLVFALRSMAQPTFDVEGHRGCRGLLPENTIPAFINAVKLGVNTLELDMCVSKDGKIVVSHDRFMNDEICTKPDGTPVTADDKGKYNIHDLTYDEIKKFDCGSRGNAKFPDQQKMAVYKPLLSDVIDTVEKYVKEHHLPPVYYNIETKSTAAGDGKLNPPPAEFVQMVYALIKEKGIISRCILQSFDVRTLQEMKKLDPKVTTALLVANTHGLSKNLAELGFKPDIYSPLYMLVHKHLIVKCHALGIKVLPWTIDDEKIMVKQKKMGVDGIITDYPDRAIKVLR